MRIAGNLVYFMATIGSESIRWQTTGSGAQRAGDEVRFGPEISGYVYFAADGGAHGVELWKQPVASTQTDNYFTASWQIIEQRENGSSDPSNQYVWSPVYVNALILRDSDTTSGGNLGKASSGLDQRIYYQQDANYNVMSILTYNSSSSAWTVAERNLYAPYGEVTITDASYTPRSPNVSAVNNDIGYQGEFLDRITGLVLMGARYYSPMLGRWLSVDPIRYDGGDMNLQEFVGANPISRVDPSGLEWKINRTGRARAEAIATDEHDMLYELAQKVGLSERNYSWLKVEHGLPDYMKTKSGQIDSYFAPEGWKKAAALPYSQLGKNNCDYKLSIPNTVYISVGVREIRYGRLKNPKSPSADFTGFFHARLNNAIDANVKAYSDLMTSLGFKVVHISDLKKADAESILSNPDTIAWFHIGHGSDTGGIDVDDPTTLDGVIRPGQLPLHHHLASLIVFSCFAGKDEHWRDLVSDNGELYFSSKNVYPTTGNWTIMSKAPGREPGSE